MEEGEDGFGGDPRLFNAARRARQAQQRRDRAERRADEMADEAANPGAVENRVSESSDDDVFASTSSRAHSSTRSDSQDGDSAGGGGGPGEEGEAQGRGGAAAGVARDATSQAGGRSRGALGAPRWDRGRDGRSHSASMTSTTLEARRASAGPAARDVARSLIDSMLGPRRERDPSPLQPGCWQLLGRYHRTMRDYTHATVPTQPRDALEEAETLQTLFEDYDRSDRQARRMVVGSTHALAELDERKDIFEGAFRRRVRLLAAVHGVQGGQRGRTGLGTARGANEQSFPAPDGSLAAIRGARYCRQGDPGLGAARGTNSQPPLTNEVSYPGQQTERLGGQGLGAARGANGQFPPPLGSAYETGDHRDPLRRQREMTSSPRLGAARGANGQSNFSREQQTQPYFRTGIARDPGRSRRVSNSDPWGLNTALSPQKEPTFYDFLPPPWNVQPETSTLPHSKTVAEKITLAHFDGTQRGYVPWRSAFIACIHTAALPVRLKMVHLAAHLATAAKRDQRLYDLACVGENPEDQYGRAIKQLERDFGSPGRLLAQKMDDIQQLREIREGDSYKLGVLGSRVRSYRTAANQCGRATDAESGIFLETCLRTLAKPFRDNYNTWALREDLPPLSLKSLLLWVDEKLRVYQLSDGIEAAAPRKASHHTFHVDTEPQRNSSTQGRATGPPSCAACNQGNHWLDLCSTFRAWPTSQRRRHALDQKLCFCCLKAGHLASACRWKRDCFKCGGAHHTLLHKEVAAGAGRQSFSDGSAPLAAPEEPRTTTPAPPANVLTSSDSYQACALRIVPLLLKHPRTGLSVKANALLDDGSGINLLDKAVADVLGLEGNPVDTSILGVGGIQLPVTMQVQACVQLTSPVTGYEQNVSVRVIPEPAGGLRPVRWEGAHLQYNHLRGIRPAEPFDDLPVSMILGCESPELLSSSKDFVGKAGEPVGRKGPLGITIAGPVRPLRHPARAYSTVHFLVEDHLSPAEAALADWLAGAEPGEDVDALAGLAPQDKEALALLERETVLENGHFVAPALWKKGATLPPCNREAAQQRLRSLLKGKAFRRPGVADKYAKVINDWEGKGYIHRVPEEDKARADAYYLPHFPVLRDDKPTSKVRPVMDAAAKGAGGSLNDCVMAGPNLLNEVPHVLLRFRRNPVALQADVREMFLQIRLKPGDRRYHRFLWTQDSQTIDYEFSRHVFGNSGSPCVALYCVRHLANLIAKKEPRAAEAMRESTLMDDTLDSFDSEEEAAAVAKTLKDTYALAGMQLTKFVSNRPSVLAAVERGARPDQPAGAPHAAPSPDSSPPAGLASDLAEPLKAPESKPADHKALGMGYDSKDDVLWVTTPTLLPLKWTRRTALALIASVYDPLGLVLPFLMEARITFRHLWPAEAAWDEPLEAETAEALAAWATQLSKLPQLRFDRLVGSKKGKLHVFADASLEACAAAAYFVPAPQGAGEPQLVVTRARLAKKKRMTVPRLELTAAVMAAELAEQVAAAWNLELDDVMFWSDSKTVLYWLRNKERRLLVYVANRVERILSITRLCNWNWTPTDQNPADLLTRGFPDLLVIESTLWQHGPAHLQGEVPSPPALNPTEETSKEMKPEKAVCLLARPAATPWILALAERKSRPRVLFRIVARMLWWAARAARLPVEHYEEKARALVLSQVQRACLPADISPGPTQTKPWAGVQATLDDQGLLRLMGRARLNPHLPRDLRWPILLPPSHPLTLALMRTAHSDLEHSGGPGAALTEFYRTFWSPHARMLSRKAANSCVPCRKAFARPKSQKMAPLPLARTLPSATRLNAFAHVGLDACGPFSIRMHRSKAPRKRWVILFTCLHVRAVHLEAVTTLDTDCTLQALQRFCSRRGKPLSLCSDNGTNFARSNQELQKWQEDLAEAGERFSPIRWNFNPPAAPHKGGVFERLVQSLKKSLVHTVGPSLLTDEEFGTALVKSEEIMNARPLLPVELHPRDRFPLTPAHFLGAQPFELPRPSTSSKYTRRWRNLQKVLDDLWAQLMHQMVPHLQHLNRWTKAQRNLIPGELVLLLEAKHRGRWPVGKVLATYPHGGDELVRVVDVLEGTKIKRRSTHRLLRLFKEDE